jgi:hypothetical protein
VSYFGRQRSAIDWQLGDTFGKAERHRSLARPAAESRAPTAIALLALGVARRGLFALGQRAAFW